MAIKILNNGIQIGNFVLSETKDGLVYSGTVTAKAYSQVKGFQGYDEGFISGGSQSAPTQLNSIEKFPFAATTVVGASVVTLTTAVESHSSHSSDVHGYLTGGRTFSPPAAAFVSVTAIRKFAFVSSTGSDTNVGILYPYNPARYNHTGHSATYWGWTTGGTSFPTGLPINIIERFPFSYDNDSQTTYGSLSQSRNFAAGHSSATHGYVSGGGTPPYVQTIDKFPFVSEDRSVAVSNLLSARAFATGLSSRENGYTSGGAFTTTPTATASVEKFPFANERSLVTVGNLTQARWGLSSCSSVGDGYNIGGSTNPTNSYGAASTTIDKFSFGIDENSAAIGALTASRFYAGGHQY